MFNLEDTKALIESVNTGVAMTDDEKATLANDVHTKLTEAFEACKKEARDAALAEAKENFRKERVKTYNRGKNASKEVNEALVREAEENGYAAGKEAAEQEMAGKESEISEELIAKLEELCKEFDKASRLVEIATHEASKEYFKESTKPLISDFIDNAINESFPKKLIVDYDRMQQLQSMCESFKKALLINDEQVVEAVKQAQTSVAEELTEAKVSLKEQTQKRISAEKMLESTKAENYLLRKVAALPTAEQKVMLESFDGKSISQINESFDREHLKFIRSHELTKPMVTETVIVESKTDDSEAQSDVAPVVESTAKTPQSASTMDAYVAVCKNMHY